PLGQVLTFRGSRSGSAGDQKRDYRDDRRPSQSAQADCGGSRVVGQGSGRRATYSRCPSCGSGGGCSAARRSYRLELIRRSTGTHREVVDQAGSVFDHESEDRSTSLDAWSLHWKGAVTPATFRVLIALLVAVFAT